MGSTFDRLCRDQLITDYPSHMKNNVHYECIMGSVAYGVSDDNSDMDIYGFTMPPKNILFPYSYGNIVGFGKKPENFEQFQKHHIIDKQRGKEYDVSIYNIVKFFNLCMENNPNMVDALFVPTRCVLHSTAVGNHVRENRRMFLSKRVWHKFKGYAFSQLHKMKNKYAKEFVDLCHTYSLDYNLPIDDLIDGIPELSSTRGLMRSLVKKIETNGVRSKRLHLIDKYGYDTKFAYHVVRLLDECEQILGGGDLDLTRSREQLKAIRRGEWSLDGIVSHFDTQMKLLEPLYAQSKLPYSPDEYAIKQLLIDCIEMHYGRVSVDVENIDAINQLTMAQEAINKVMRTL